MPNSQGKAFAIDHHVLDLVRGVCHDDPKWTVQGFVSAAIMEKIARDGLRPEPRYTVRLGRPPKVSARPPHPPVLDPSDTR